MNNSTKVLIIEDEYQDFEKITKNLYNYECYPRNEVEFNVFLAHIRARIEGINPNYVKEADEFFKNYFSEINFQAIILDIRLGTAMDDKSGLEFLNFLRGRYFNLTPIILLSMLPPKEVKSGLTSNSGWANYYLYKGGLQGRLADTFFENELKPVLAMLINSYRINTQENIIKFTCEKFSNDILAYFEKKFIILQTNIDILKHQEKELKEFSRVSLSILKYIAKNQKKSAGNLVNKLIEEFNLAGDVPNIEKYRKPILEALNKGYNDIKKAITEEGKKELIECLKDLIRENLGLNEDDPVMFETLVVLCKFLKKSVRGLILL